MRRWHTREQYRRRVLEIAERAGPIGLGADLITGFPGETEADHAVTRDLVLELPFTYLHVFPFSPRDGTPAAGLPGRVPQRVAGERARDLRELGQGKGLAYRSRVSGSRARVVLEDRGTTALTGDYLRVGVPEPPPSPGRLLDGTLQGGGGHLYIAWPRENPSN
jgi:threonylcarbamoyladenosine tRNA methylthiotransferase MtaB